MSHEGHKLLIFQNQSNNYEKKRPIHFDWNTNFGISVANLLLQANLPCYLPWGLLIKVRENDKINQIDNFIFHQIERKLSGL